MRMKHLTVAALTLLLSVSCSQRQEDYPFRNPDLPIDERIDDLLKRLTAEEKIGQMMNTTPAIERLGIPEYDWWNEALHGVARAGKATVFPQAIAMAATFDDDALYETFTMVSDEARAKYHQYQKNKEYDRYKGLTFWTPNINIFRDPRWGRGMETYGEDPYLTERMGVAVVKGLQGDDPKYFKTHACAKHYGGGLIGEEIPAAGGGIAVRALEDGEGVVAVLFYQPGDTGGVVGGVGLKGSGVEGLGKGLARGQPLADGVGLVAVGDDGGGAEHPHRGVDNKGGVGHFGGVKGLGADAVRGLHEDPVAGVLAASHDKIGNDGLLPVGGAAQHDAASGIGVAA